VSPSLPKADQQLLLTWLANHSKTTLAPFVSNLQLYTDLMRKQHNWAMAALLLQAAKQQLSLAAAAAKSAAAAGAAADAHVAAGLALAKLFAPVLAHEFVGELPAAVLAGLLELGLQPGRLLQGTKQTLLHAALVARCSGEGSCVWLVDVKLLWEWPLLSLLTDGCMSWTQCQVKGLTKHLQASWRLQC
jgi:hypothetical protein